MGFTISSGLSLLPNMLQGKKRVHGVSATQAGRASWRQKSLFLGHFSDF